MATHAQVGTLLAHHSYEVWHIAISPDGRLLASGTPSQDRRTIRLFDLRARRLVSWLSGHDQYALAVGFNPRGDLLASGGTDSVVRLWRVADFWPQPAARSRDDPGALLRDYLEHPPYTVDEMDRVIGQIERLTGFKLVGTVAMPVGQPR
jgi:WD40 repeat protein